MRFVETNQLVAGFVPVDLQDGANNGDWVSMKNYNHLTVVFFKDAGTAGDDPTLTVKQATNVSGGSEKALNFTTIYTKQGADLATVGTFTKNTQAAANAYTDTASAEAQAIWVVEFDASDLDTNNNFDCVQASVADIGGNAQLGCLLYILSEPSYAGATAPSAIAN